MCNVDDGEKEPVDRTIKSAIGRKCVKCERPGILITRIHDSFCRDCFMVYVIHKFRSTFGKSKLIRDGERVLVAFSGGANSAALLHLISEGLSERAQKKLRFTPTLLYVDECTILETSDDERCKLQRNVCDIMTSTGFPAYTTSLEQGILKDLDSVKEEAEFYWEATTDTANIRAPAAGDQKRLQSLLSSLASTSSKEDFLKNLRRQLIVTVARSLGLKKVLMGDCSSRLSVQILTDISQGRGSQVALDTAFSDARYDDDIMIVRPIRDLNAKELALYNHLCGVESVTIPNLSTKAHTGASIARLTESFVTGLQADFPSTVSNIVRTSEKLLHSDAHDVTKCSFCQSPLDTNTGASSAVNAIHFSKKFSQFSHLQSLQSAPCDKTSGNNVSTTSNAEPSNSTFSPGCVTDEADPVISSLCFGCQLSLRDFGDDIDALPSFIASRAQKITRTDREKMKEQLSGFLLDENVC